MGITVFDLFGEIMTVDDMHRFLKKMGVNEGYSGAALILRSFLVLMDLNKVRSLSISLVTDRAKFHYQEIQSAWENTMPASALNECHEVKVEAFSDEEEILRDDDIRLGIHTKHT